MGPFYYYFKEKNDSSFCGSFSNSSSAILEIADVVVVMEAGFGAINPKKFKFAVDVFSL